jgi:hypothetical protein
METDINFDLDWLFRVRTVVARTGEMDLARWWNTDGQLGAQGAAVLRRGLPRTHHFAQARTVITVAAARSAQIFDPPGCVTLWKLGEMIEDRIDVLWEAWLDAAGAWSPFFERVAAIAAVDVAQTLRDLDLVDDREMQTYRALKKSLDGRSLELPARFDGGRSAVALLALAHGTGSPGNLVVPYARRAGA